MVSHTFFAGLSVYIAKGKALAGKSDTNKPFRGVNVILSGDFHQFLPVPGSRNASLFWPCDSSKDSAEGLLGQKLYEELSIVLHLKEQVRVTNLRKLNFQSERDVQLDDTTLLEMAKAWRLLEKLVIYGLLAVLGVTSLTISLQMPSSHCCNIAHI